jgi:hypothetical protein
LVDELKQALKEGLAANPPLETDSGEFIEGHNKPLFINLHGLDDKVRACIFVSLINTVSQ